MIGFILIELLIIQITNPMSRKAKFGVFGLVVLAGAFLAYSYINKPHKNLKNAEPQFTLTASELFNEFAQDEAKANERYVQPTPALIQVSGVVSESNIENGVTNVMLKTDDDMSYVICELDTHSEHAKKEYKPGSNVKFKGLCAGLTMDVILNRCIEVQ